MSLPSFDATDYAAIGSYLAILVGGGLAWGQLRHVRRVHREQTRPYVIVDFEFRSILVYLAIKNIGSTIAQDVKIEFDEPLKAAVGEASGVEESPLFKSPIPMISPGRKILVFFDVYNQRADRKDLPMRYSVTVTYRDTDGEQFKDPPYPLDLGMYEGAELEPKGIHELVGEVHAMTQVMKQWTNGSRGLLVHAVDHVRHEERRARPSRRRIAAQIRKEKGWGAYVRWVRDRQLRKYGWKR